MASMLDIPNPAPGTKATSLNATNRDAEVKIRMDNPTEVGQRTPDTVHTMFARTVKNAPENHPALLYKEKQSDPWTTITFQEYYDLSCAAAKAFIKLGLERFDSVCLLGFNAPEWFIGHWGSIFAGGLSCGVYATNGPESCQYIAENAVAVIYIVENEAQMNKILSIKSQLPKLKAIIQYKGTIKDKKPFQYEWKELIEMGRAESDVVLEHRLRDQLPNQCCTLIYTSGTTGFPKGVMLSHDNLTWTTAAILNCLPVSSNKEIHLSYLPLSHSAGLISDVCASLFLGGSVYFAQPDALKGTLGATLKEVRPTLFFGVPRVWEKIQESIETMKKSVGPSKSIPNGALKAGLGLDRCHTILSGGAPIRHATLEYFLNIEIRIHELFGMTESSGPNIIAIPPDTFRIGSIGKQMPGGATRLDPCESSQEALPESARKGSSGEVCMYGRNVCMGYLNEPEKTEDLFTADGWLRSGDIGYEDEDGYLFIVGRIKELIITSGGENIAPIPMEDRIKEILPVISNAMVIGDKRKYLTMLITIKTNMDENQAPLDTLAPNVIEWAKSLNSPVTTVTQVLDSQPPELYAAIDAAIKKLNASSVSRATHIQKFTILPRDFSIAGEELGPTLKLRRGIVDDKYKDIINKLYE